MRKFKLYNAIGEMYDLNAKKSFFHDISGMGFEKDSNYEQIGYQYIKTEEKIKQPTPTGKIRFINYAEYLNFVKFLQKEPLTLEYITEETFYLSCECKKLQKTELEAIGLDCDISLIGIGQWYQKIICQLGNTEPVGKTYSYGYPYTYADNRQGIVEIVSVSEVESPAKLIIIGKSVNPTWVHYVNGEVYASGKLNCTIQEGHRVVVSSVEPYSIVETDAYGNEIEDRYKDSDFNTERFITLQRGNNRIAFTNEGENTIKIIVEGMIYYASV